MSHQVSTTLPPALLDRLSVGRAVDRADTALLLCSVDDHGWPHPAMLSSLELVAKDVHNIRFAVYGTSRTAQNLSANGCVTLVVADESGVFYIKGDARRLEAPLVGGPELAAFNMRVVTVLEDNPAAYEGAAVTTGIRVRRTRVHETSARALLGELLAVG